MSFDAIQIHIHHNKLIKKAEKRGEKRERRRIRKQVKTWRDEAKELCHRIVPRKRPEQYGDGLRKGHLEAYNRVLDLLSK